VIAGTATLAGRYLGMDKIVNRCAAAAAGGADYSIRLRA
jgi:hypothetical protein